MADKVLNTRILLKYDSYANWTSNNPVLKAGEMAIATVANIEANAATGFTNLPNVVIKVGDGATPYNQLKFVSALAADVHGWAKEASKPSYTYTEIGGLEDHLKDVAHGADTDTQYTIVRTDETNYKYELRSKGLNDVEWTKVADIDLSALVARVAALEAKFAGMTEGTVVDHVKAKIAGLDADEVKIGAGEIIESVSEADGVISVTKRALASTDFADDLVPEAAVAGLTERLAGIDSAVTTGDANTLKAAKEYSDAQLKTKVEGLDYDGGEFGATKFATKITEVDGVVAAEYAQPVITDIQGLDARLTGIENNAGNLGTNKQDVLTWDEGHEYDAQSNHAATVSSIVSRINALDYAGGEFGDHKFATKIVEENGVIEATYAQPVIADIDGLTDRLSGIDGEIAKKQDQLYFTSTPDNDKNKVATQSYVNEAVADLNGAMHFVGKLEAVPEGEANEAYSAGDVILVGYDEYVFDGTTWQPLGNESIYQTKELATEQHNALTKLVTDLETKHDSEMDTLEKKHDDELAALDKKYADKIEALDYNDEGYVDGQFINKVTEVNGVIAVERRALKATDIPELEQSKITGLVTKLAELEQGITDGEAGALADAKAYTDAQLKAKVESLDADEVKAGQGEIIDSVKEADGVVTVTKRALVKEDIPVIEQAQVNGLADALAAAGKTGTDAADKALADAQTYVDGKLDALDYDDAAVEKNFVTEVKQANGAISVQRAAVANIALTGSTDDLVQGAMTLVFNCGNSQVGTANEFANL